MYTVGTIVLVPFPFTDLTAAKLRPALIISSQPEAEDLIVAFITSKTAGHAGIGQYKLSSTEQEFIYTGLKTDSVVRFDKLITLNKQVILGELGAVSAKLLQQMKKTFDALFPWSS